MSAARSATAEPPSAKPSSPASSPPEEAPCTGCWITTCTPPTPRPCCFTQLGDRSGQARARLNIGATFAAEGNYGTALEQAGQALELLQGGDRRILLANALNNIGWYHIHLGDFQQAVSYGLRSLDVHRGSGNGADGEAAAWSTLGSAHHHLGRYAQAIDHYQHALRIYRDLGSRYEEAGTLTRLGDAQQALGSPAAARDSWQRALTILQNLHHPDAKPVHAKLCALDA